MNINWVPITSSEQTSASHLTFIREDKELVKVKAAVVVASTYFAKTQSLDLC